MVRGAQNVEHVWRTSDGCWSAMSAAIVRAFWRRKKLHDIEVVHNEEVVNVSLTLEKRDMEFQLRWQNLIGGTGWYREFGDRGFLSHLSGLTSSICGFSLTRVRDGVYSMTKKWCLWLVLETGEHSGKTISSKWLWICKCITLHI